MGIAVVLRNEDRIDIKAVDRPYEPLVGWSQRKQFPMLGHIDRYGYTIFNGGQMQALLAELEEIELVSPELLERAADAVAQIRELCRIGVRRPHSYLWFIGD